MKEIFDIFVENALNERLDSIILDDIMLKEYDLEFDVLNDELNKKSLKEEEKRLLSRMLDVQVAHSSRYAELAYRQGVFDTVNLLKSMKIIHDTI